MYFTNQQNPHVGIDVGSTTLKLVVMNAQNDIIYKNYRRHKAKINEVLTDEFQKINELFPNTFFSIHITGSAGIGISKRTNIPFIQEVVASVNAVNYKYSAVKTMIDIGGEDAKIVLFEENRQPEIRMNGSCAGGTGAYIDQMADLLNISVSEMAVQAESSTQTYPIASRCGVFAKTDVQNLIARNIQVPDIAASIFYSVALQTLTSLGHGSKIESPVMLIGGPLTFIPTLRESFQKILNLEEEDFILPQNSQYFPAIGCAIANEEATSIFTLPQILSQLSDEGHFESDEIMPVLFENDDAYTTWKMNRKIKHVNIAHIGEEKVLKCFMGIDSGSTTTKILIIDTHGNCVFKYYAPNEGDPLRKTAEGLNEFFALTEEKGVHPEFISSGATGYGEDLIKSALGLDYGIVETMAHLKGAQFVDPNVSFILDIGGQDMKSIFTKNGVISKVELNEACSSGCGSFLQTFASTVDIKIEDFARIACRAKYPYDLGTRCTVFMNSKVKQALSENAKLEDISAGLAYSVVRNCLFKVLKINNLNELGDNIVVQGGTFKNDAVFRALELLSGKKVSSTDMPEMMGALGAALYAQSMYRKDQKSTRFTGIESLPHPENIQKRELNCKGCTNRCKVLRFSFENGNISYAGNKCEKIFYNKESAPKKGYNAFEVKNRILFEKELKHHENAINIGIPRVLNMFENYPFWSTLLNECGFNITLSPESTYKLYQKGVGSVMSENICFPAKLVHGHVQSLIEEKVDRIFLPLVVKEEKEQKSQNNSYNCPIVTGYSEVIKSSINPEGQHNTPLDKPVIVFTNKTALRKGCYRYLESLGVSKQVFDKAFNLALEARKKMKEVLVNEQKEKFEKAVESGEYCFVVAGRPYHSDPLIHQKVGQILSDLGVHAFTDDIFRNEESIRYKDLNIVTQWSYPNRVIQSALKISEMPSNVQMIQLNSFGCGPDSFFLDEAREILECGGKTHTVIRIDEIASPGSIRLRLRSLIESIHASKDEQKDTRAPFDGYQRFYNKSDRQKTIIAPWFSDYFSPFVPALGEVAGYKIVNLPISTKETAELGLKYGHNEVCYPSTLVLGDIINAFQSGSYDPKDTVVAITQTGGQCRATNYLAQIKSGLTMAGYSNVPIVAIGSTTQHDQKEFSFNIWKMLDIIVCTVDYSDALQEMYNSTKIREINKGDCDRLVKKYIEKADNIIRRNKTKDLLRLLEDTIQEFNQVEIDDEEYTQVGIVGEIYVKYNSFSQGNVSKWLRDQKIEIVTPGIMSFLSERIINNPVNESNHMRKGSWISNRLTPFIESYVDYWNAQIDKRMTKFRFRRKRTSIHTLAEMASNVLDLANQFGESWALAGEISNMAKEGIDRVVCIQPFGCIANHVIAKGVEKRLKELHPNLNLLYLDVDGGTAPVNLQNRLHFLIPKNTNETFNTKHIIGLSPSVSKNKKKVSIDKIN